MSERTQIDVVQGNKVIRIFSGWGTPENIRPALRAAASAGHSKALDIAREIIRQVPDASFGLHLIAEDYPEDALSFRYKVDVSSTPWHVAQTKMPGHKIILNHKDHTFTLDPKLTPAVTRSFRVGK